MENMPLSLFKVYLFLFVNSWFDLVVFFITFINTNLEYGYEDKEK